MIVTAHRQKTEGFVAMRLQKADGRVWAYVPSNHPTTWRARRVLVRRARQWATGQQLDKLFVDTRRRNGNTYWRRVR